MRLGANCTICLVIIGRGIDLNRVEFEVEFEFLDDGCCLSIYHEGSLADETTG